ncbi:MAG: dihydropteroate synthase [Candidatus Dadabacteria bacterium]|nr:MAG: dihydropteroate synthase [Candidatus Dadabacteria bacterium]
MITRNPIIVGVLNVTPDSFSDGGLYLSQEKALEHARNLIAAGADIIDIGGQSTRPGSKPVSAVEEWERISEPVSVLSKECVVSVDTYYSSVAEKAISAGAKIINDISAGHDPEMFSLLASEEAKIVIMFSRCLKPHEFGRPPARPLIETIKKFLLEKVDLAMRSGISEDQIILDTGMGAFISDHANDSVEVVRNYGAFAELGFPLLFGCSRKGFTRIVGEKNISERDSVSALFGCMAFLGVADRVPLYLRVHNVLMQLKMIRSVL